MGKQRGAKRFECSVCSPPTTFTTKNGLHLHQRIHSGVSSTTSSISVDFVDFNSSASSAIVDCKSSTSCASVDCEMDNVMSEKTGTLKVGTLCATVDCEMDNVMSEKTGTLKVGTLCRENRHVESRHFVRYC